MSEEDSKAAQNIMRVAQNEPSDNRLIINNTRNRIFQNVFTSHEEDCAQLTRDRRNCRIAHDALEIITKLLVGTSGIVAFAAGMFDDAQLYSYISGGLSMVALVTQQFATYSNSECKDRTDKLNQLLERLSIPNVPPLYENEHPARPE